MGKREKERKARQAQEKVGDTKDIFIAEAVRRSEQDTITLLNYYMVEQMKISEEFAELFKDRDTLCEYGRPRHDQDEWFELIRRRIKIEKRCYGLLTQELQKKEECLEEWMGTPREEELVLGLAEFRRGVEIREHLLHEWTTLHKILKEEVADLKHEPPISVAEGVVHIAGQDPHPARKVCYDYCRALFRRFFARSVGILSEWSIEQRPAELRDIEMREVVLLATAVQYLYEEATPTSLLNMLIDDNPAPIRAGHSQQEDRKPVTKQEIERIITLRNALMNYEKRHALVEAPDAVWCFL